MKPIKIWTREKNKKLQELKRQGQSYKEIGEILNVTERAVSNKITKLKKAGWNFNKYKKFFLENVPKELKLISIALYWGEGTKSGNKVEFTNSDSAMIKLFLKFLYSLKVTKEKIRCRVKGTEMDELWWSKELQIPQTQFRKRTPYRYKQRKRILEHGTCQIRYYSKELKDLIMSNIPMTYPN